MNINFEHYRIFASVARHQSMTLAAKELFLSQPAVSQSVQHLESLLNCKLFYRIPRGVRLTPEGQVLYASVGPACEQIQAGERKIAQMLMLDSGEIKIGASDMTLHLYLLEHLEAFHHKHPKIRMNVLNSTTPETIAALRAGQIDFGVVSAPVLDAKGLQIYPVCEIQDILIAGEQFAALKNKTLSLRQVAQYPLICLSSDTSTRRYLDDFFLSHGVSLEPEFNLATTDLIVPFVKRNFGIGIVVQTFALQALQAGEIFQVHTKEKIPPRQICVVTAAKNTISQAGQTFLNALFAR